MTITLRPEDERWVEDAVASGMFRDPADAVASGLEALRAEDEGRDEIREKIDRAFAQFERGEFYTPEEAKALREQRKAEWLAENRR